MGNNQKLCKTSSSNKSDKGNSVIVVDNSTYYTKGYQLFNDQNFLKSSNDNEKKYKLLKNFI